MRESNIPSNEDMSSDTGVEDPRVDALECHLLQDGNEAELIPTVGTLLW